MERSDAISDLSPRRYFGLDIVARTPRKVRECIRTGDAFIKEIIEQGTVLYERKRTRLVAERSSDIFS